MLAAVASALKVVQIDVREFHSFDLVSAVHEYERLCGISAVLTAATDRPDINGHGHRYEGPDRRFGVVGFIDIPQRRLLERYQRDAKSIWFRAMAAASLYPVIAVVLPGPASRRRILKNLPDLPPPWRLGFSASTVERVTGPDTSNLVFWPASGLGCIMFTTRMSLDRDLVEILPEEKE